LAQAIGALIGSATFTELGAGVGCYAAVVESSGAKVIAAVDGAENIYELTGGAVARWDLSRPMEATADWVLSLEVAEHIPRLFEAEFVGNAVRNARCGLILSWGLPAQRRGSGHVNGRNTSYVRQTIEARGFRHHEAASAQLQRAVQLPWIRNLAVFTRVAAHGTRDAQAARLVQRCRVAWTRIQ
jgi:hypothetical protein